MRAPTAMAVFLLTTSALLARADEPPAGQKYALLVGVQQYSEAKELRPLPYSERDVTELADVLRDGGYKGDNVVLMTRAAANDDLRYMPLKKRILKELRLILADRQEGDTVLVAFAEATACTSAATRTATSARPTPSWTTVPRCSPLALTVYAEWRLEKCKAGTKVLLVDACRNDPFQDKTRAAQVVALESVTRSEVPDPPRGVAAFFSCSENEKAYESDKLKHGVFFHFVIEGLKGEAAPDKGEVTLLGLSEYVTQKVGDYVRAAYGLEARVDGPQQRRDRRNWCGRLRRRCTSAGPVTAGKEPVRKRPWMSWRRRFGSIRAPPPPPMPSAPFFFLSRGQFDTHGGTGGCSAAGR